MVHPSDAEPLVAASLTWQFVGGLGAPDDEFTRGQMYVERYEPRNQRQAWPVVLWHGGVQTGTNFTATPDGRSGWLQDFLRAGYTVYVVDQPERGRSGHAPEVIAAGALMRYTRSRIAERFTGTAASRLWPQAQMQTQWPGSGLPGDAVFENFFASQVPMLEDRDAIERLNRDAGAALLDRIGPAILVTHSQSGPFGWLVADARPQLVKAIVAIEPNGPPFREVQFHGGPDWFSFDKTIERPWGITRVPMTYADAPGDVAPAPEWHPELGIGDRLGGYLQAAPAGRLVNVRGRPILMVTAQASYHATYDHVTSAFLTQAGVEHEFVRLEERGIRGNGHMVMLEQNNHEIADLLIDWLAKQRLA